MEAQIEELCGMLCTLQDEISRRAFLDRSPQVFHAEIVEGLSEAVRHRMRVDVPQALSLAEAALTIAGQLHEEKALARALRAKANVLWFIGQCKRAVDLFQEAARLFEKAGDMNEVGRTLSSSIQSLALLGEYETAFSAA